MDYTRAVNATKHENSSVPLSLSQEDVDVQKVIEEVVREVQEVKADCMLYDGNAV